jgi:hypothetical protein
VPWPRLVSAVIVPALVFGCGGKATTKNSQTKAAAPLSECTRDAECSLGMCLCGYCTQSCDSDADCGRWQDAACLPAARVGCSREDTLCLPPDAVASPSDPGASAAPAPDILTEPTVEPDSEPDAGESSGESTAKTPDLAECHTQAATGLVSASDFISSYFAEVEAVTARTAELQQSSADLFGTLGDILAADDASADAIAQAYKAFTDGGSSDGVQLLLWAARCPIAVLDVQRAASACDPDLDPSETPLDCKGTCVLDATTSCDGGAIECRQSSPENCEGYCEGPCEVALGADGTCAGACEGTCRTTPPDGACDEVTACVGDVDAPVPCTASCEGEVVPPEVAPGCAQTSQAEVWLAASCTAPTPVPLYDPVALDGGVPTAADGGVSSDFDATLHRFLEAFARVLELNERATLALQAAAVLNAALPAVTAEVGASGDADLTCAKALLEAAPASLGQAGADINDVMVDTSTLIAEVP